MTTLAITAQEPASVTERPDRKHVAILHWRLTVV